MSSDFHERKKTRLKYYDYTQNGAYFVTICTHERAHLFGHITPAIPAVVVLNEYGDIVKEEWEHTASLRHEIEMGPYVIMPDHFHGIVNIVGPRRAVAIPQTKPIAIPETTTVAINFTEKFGKPVMGSLPTIVRAFKSAVTKRIRESTAILRGGMVWQSGYYERIIRDEWEYERVCEYIHLNPENWSG